MKKIYIFGAGNNAYGIISYIGKENVIAIIDNEEKKQGDNLLGIPIISLQDYILKNNGEQIVVSAAIYNEIVNQLKKNKIYNYSISPMLVRGMVSPEEIYNECNLKNDKDIYILGQNIVADKFIDWMKKERKSIKINIILENEEINRNLNFENKILIFKEILNDNERKLLSKFKKIFDIYKIISKDRKEKQKQLLKFKNKYKGRKCFIVCNGPSLKMSDLERLYDNNIYTIGCNLIFNIFNDTYWRPDSYVINDFNIYSTYYSDIVNLTKNNNMFIKGFCKMENLQDIQGVNYYYEDCRRKYNNISFSDDITKEVISGYTVTYDMLQIAVYMGFSEIYLIGADFNYIGDASQQGNHVYDYKVKDKRKFAGITYINLNINAMRTAQEYAKKYNKKIYNATRGGKLEVFERKNLDDVFKEIEDNEM